MRNLIWMSMKNDEILDGPLTEPFTLKEKIGQETVPEGELL